MPQPVYTQIDDDFVSIGSQDANVLITQHAYVII